MFVALADPISSSFNCTVCDRTYSHKKTLVRHQQFECQKEPKFECPLCGKKCKLKSNLKQHFFRVHSNLLDLGLS